MANSYNDLVDEILMMLGVSYSLVTSLGGLFLFGDALGFSRLWPSLLTVPHLVVVMMVLHKIRVHARWRRNRLSHPQSSLPEPEGVGLAAFGIGYVLVASIGGLAFFVDALGFSRDSAGFLFLPHVLAVLLSWYRLELRWRDEH